jgi:hypothetical protein
MPLAISAPPSRVVKRQTQLIPPEMVFMMLKGSAFAVEALIKHLHVVEFSDIGDWCPPQVIPNSPDQVVTVTTKRYHPTHQGVRWINSDPVFEALDRQFQAIFDEVQWESDSELAWLDWNNASRNLLYHYLSENDGLAEGDCLKLQLWGILGGFVKFQPPALAGGAETC